MNELQEIIKAFSLILKRPVVLAGGSVRDHLIGQSAKDYDLFILGQEWKEWDAYKTWFAKEFQEALSQFPKIESVIEWHKSEPFLLETIRWNNKEIQIMATPCSSMEELIATFDWGVCCFAYNGETFVYNKEDLDAIKPGGYIRLNKLTFPFSSLRRGYRFSERFVMRIRRDDIQTICKKILETKSE